MKSDNETKTEVEYFLNQWQTDSSGIRDCFSELYGCVRDLAGVSCEFVQRPGVSYSIRPKHEQQSKRELFAIIDVIDDTPDQRWLSVCFYEDMITDPDQRGEVIPGGLAGDDGYCFDIDLPDKELVSYLVARLLEAYKSAMTQ